MKRSAFGFGLLLVLLLLGLLTSAQMERCHAPIARSLEQAGQCAMEGDWDTAQALLDTARTKWERCWHFSASLADHEPMEEIDGLFARLEVYAPGRDTQEFAAACAELSRRVHAMSQAHALNWWNVL